MNRVIKVIFNVCLLALFLPLTSAAQDNSYQTDRTIRFNGNSRAERVILNIDDETKELHLKIRSRIREGSLKIEIYDPSGGKRGNFVIEGQLGTNATSSESVEGRISKSIPTPQQGEWIIKIIPVGVHGQIWIKSDQVLEQL